MMRGQLCTECDTYLASQFTRHHGWYCKGCHEKKNDATKNSPAKDADESEQHFTLAQADYLFRLGKAGKALLVQRCTSVGSININGGGKPMALYHHKDCLRMALQQHGGFFGMHLEMAKFRKTSKHWPAQASDPPSTTKKSTTMGVVLMKL